MFDPEFFEAVLPGYVTAIANEHPDQMPVVHIYLGDGTVYDLCRVVGITNTWVAAAYFREPANCDDVEVAFLHLSTIARVTLSLPRKTARTIGFGAMPAEWLAQSEALHAAADAAA